MPLLTDNFSCQATLDQARGAYPLAVPNPGGGAAYVHATSVAPQGATLAIRFPGALPTFVQRWQADQVTLYRGIIGSSYSWEEMRGNLVPDPTTAAALGQPILPRVATLVNPAAHGAGRIPTPPLLRSEGTSYRIDWTGGNLAQAAGTRWLPFAEQRKEGAGAAISDLAMMLHHMRRRNVAGSLPLGIVVRIQAGRSLARKVCFTTPGEYQVEGPLAAPGYAVECSLWTDATGAFTFCPWPNARPATLLPPVRPHGASGAPDAWWDQWLGDVAAFLQAWWPNDHQTLYPYDLL